MQLRCGHRVAGTPPPPPSITTAYLRPPQLVITIVARVYVQRAVRHVRCDNDALRLSATEENFLLHPTQLPTHGLSLSLCASQVLPI
ncbi:hypothetical protein Taro_010625 [Colocasia esculenta]|uniref:Uncharacterized protein n=1 Tax=Colocasia esculenta TaxID=4460 RepID=A0A843UDP6_COLES|nr:hypothetical protein [Colocasia esculenta]